MTQVAAGVTRGHRPSVETLLRTTGFVAVACAGAAGVLIALAGAAADHGYLLPLLVRRPWAGFIVGPLAGIGIAGPLHVFFAELAVMAVAYAAAVAYGPRVGLKWIWAVVLLLHVVFLLAPPLLSTDVFNYVDVARLGGRYHLDPYVVPPAGGPHDTAYVYAQWRHAVTDYGPLYTFAIRPLGRLGVAEAMWAFKAMAALAGLGCTALVAWIARRRGTSASRAVAAFGLNPLLLVWTVGGAHNDLVMLLVLLGGVALLLAGRPVSAGAALVAAAAVKLSAGLAIPFMVLRREPGRLRLLAGIAAGAAAVAALSALAYQAHAVQMLDQLQQQQQLVDIGSVPRGIAYALGREFVLPDERRMLHIALAVWIAGWLVYTLRGGDALRATGWALLAVSVASTWLLPWYLVWPLAFAAATGNWRLLVATCALGASYAIGHAPLA